MACMRSQSQHLIFRSAVVLSLAILLLTLSCFAQQPKVLAPHRPVDPRDPISKTRQEQAVPRSMIGGFWMIDSNRKASIYLKNSLETSPITVAPVLFLSNGTRYGLEAVTLQPSGTSVISINDALEHQGVAPWGILSGYVEIEYSWAWDPLCMTVTSLDAVHSTIFTTGFQPAVIKDLPVRSPKVMDGLNTVEGLWWKPDPKATGFVALSNASHKPAEAKVKISNENNVQIGEQSVHLSPHGTKILQLNELQSVPAGSTGGLTIQYDGPASTVLINGGLEDQESGFSANLPLHFFDTPEPSQPALETYAELGLMTGAADPMMAFPAGTTFTPFSVARNVGEGPVTVTPSFYWMQGGAVRSARLSAFTLAPFTSASIDVPSLLVKAGLGSFRGNVNLILEAQGPSRSLLLASGSVDIKNTYVFQVLPRGIQESAAKSISYWSIANGDDTMVTIWNPADEAQNFSFSLNFTGGHYAVPVHLEARATQTFNVSEIIQNHVPDAEGNIIPPAIQEGSAKISGLKADNEQILVAMDAGTYNVRKATCSYYCISCDGTVYQYVDYGTIIPFTVGTTSQFYLHETWNTGWTTYTSTASWSSNHTNIATVGSTSGQGHGMSAGTTTFAALANNTPIYNSYYCNYNAYCPYNGQASGSANETVTKLSCTSSIVRGGTVTCTVTPTGVSVSGWKFTDSQGTTVTRSTNTTSLTWSGTMVTGGTVNVTVNAAQFSASITVSNRNWHTNPASPAEVANGTFIVLPVPPTPTGTDSGMGYSKWWEAYNSPQYLTIGDGGPNQGYTYFTSNLSFSQFYYQYEINPDLENTASTFYQNQCGRNGWILGSNLLTQTKRHEYNSSVQSHHAFYSTSLNANNAGDFLEQQIALPGADINTFANNAKSGIDSRFTTVGSATAVEPYPVNYSETGTSLGNVNYGPSYGSCN